jgi:small conductance mechanosensitive channel
MVFGLFYYAAKGLKSLISRLTARCQRHRNLGLVLGRLSQWLTVFVGLLVALTFENSRLKAHIPPNYVVEHLSRSSEAA